MPPALGAALALSAAVLAAHGVTLASRGFYNDDYGWLPVLLAPGASSLLGIGRAFFEATASTHVVRPTGFLYFPVLFRLFGADPLGYQCAYLLVDLLLAWNVFRLLEEEGLSRPAAFAAALLAALYPNHDSTHYWMTNSAGSLALAGVLWALRLWRSDALARRLWALPVYLASALLYESSALLALLPCLLDLGAGRRPLEVLRRHAGLIVCLALVVGWQRALVPAWQGIESHRMSLSLRHVWDVLLAGLECTVLNRLTHLMARSAAFAAGAFGPGHWAAFLAGGVLVLALARALVPREKPRSRLLLRAAGAFFLLGYAPYFFDPNYTPSVFDPTNRVNLVASLGGACLWVWALGSLRAADKPAPRRLGDALSALLLLGFLLSCQASALQWARAFGEQGRILDALAPRLAALEGPADLLLFSGAERVGSATVFESTYDLNGALQLRLRREGLRARVANGRARFEEKAAVLDWYGVEELPYARLYAFDARDGRFGRISSREDGERFLKGL